MSFQAMTWAAEQKLPAMQKIVLLMLANRVNKDTGLCCPSHDKLAIDCGMTKRSVIQQIEKLENNNFLTVLREIKNSVKQVNKYRLNLNISSESDSLPLVNDVHYPSESDSLPLVNDVHYPSESDSLGVVNDVHINQEIKPVNLTTTTEKNLNEKKCGGGDFLDLKKTESSNLIFPKSLTSKEQETAIKLLEKCDGSAQEILDALEASIRAGQIKKSPLSFLGGMVRRYETGTFDPTPGLHISIERNKKQTNQRVVEEITSHETVMKKLNALTPDNGTPQENSALTERITKLQKKQEQSKNLST